MSNSKYKFEVITDRGQMIVEGRVADGHVYMHLSKVGGGTKTETIECPIIDGTDAEMSVSTNFIAMVGRLVCVQMGLPEDSLESLLLFQRNMDTILRQTEVTDQLAKPTNNKKDDIH